MDRGAWWAKSMGSQRVRHDLATNTFQEKIASYKYDQSEGG